MNVICNLDKCMQPLEPGPCTKFIDRHYFDVTTRKCTKFQYGGCRGMSLIQHDYKYVILF